MFSEKVRRTIQEVQEHDYSTIAARITAKRMDWLDRTLPTLKAGSAFTPREAFELLFFEQMGLDRDELPMVSESANEITWLSINPCALLEACRELRLDTRQVCRPINEKATQAFISRLNPELRFHRSYEKIRPIANHCKEQIIRVDFAANMARAIREARLARTAGLPARGAVVTYADQILGQGHDSRGMARNLHAVENVLRQAAENFGDQDLCGGILFSTCEPCPKCTMLAIQANLTTLVSGESQSSSIDRSGPGSQITGRQLIEQFEANIEIIPGILAEACRALNEQVP